MRFVMVSKHYPVEGDPIFVFSQQIAEAMAYYHNVETVVISPQSITRKLIHRKRITKSVYKKELDNGNTLTVYAYPYLTFSDTKKGFLKKLQDASNQRALRRCIKKAKIGETDYCYSMFWEMGKQFDEALSKLKINTNLIVESSESVLQNGNEIEEYNFNNLKAIVCVSSEKVNECNRFNLIEKAPYVLIPNGFDANVFKPLDKKSMREKLNLPQEAFIIAFVGSFIPRKGIIELNHVLKSLDDVYSIFIGGGPNPPDCEHILFKGSLDHDNIPEYLCAADVFVLPTKHEGCANVIVEALGCGLPIISSKRDFNKEILDDDCAILIDPDNEDQLKEAILKIKNDEKLREKMSEASYSMGKTLTIEMRTKNILAVIKNI
ncbi:glycosyltransferase family 4 protein [Pseudobutyrivibrio sp. MD2005]|uniref:glycosyltransferase family 4 protein n=1 Tax=Pseudobutyrivibrio sp. MD2005 TaxID=1410616 RepID=UPI000486A142|nr:glycosyltransferase family 4 protein [Pseudobutyrivibrio sp. MD2005]